MGDFDEDVDNPSFDPAQPGTTNISHRKLEEQDVKNVLSLIRRGKGMGPKKEKKYDPT